MARGQQREPVAPASPAVPKLRRQRASPSRLTKLYKDLTEEQRERIREIGFGGLLQIASPTLPAEFADWLVGECYDAETSELVLLGRGRVAVNANSVSHILGLPSEGDEVKYDLDVSAINFINSEFAIDEGSAPSIDCVLERLKGNRTCNDEFLRSWLMIAISTFLCPSTGLCISPRCYPPLVDLSKIKDLNWCQFVVDQLKVAALKMGKRKSFRGCLLALVIVYADSLEVASVQIPPTTPRVAAWSRQLLSQVIKLDRKQDGSFGKLKLKETSYSTPESSLFHMEEISRFVSSKTPRGISYQRKRMLNTAVTQFCSGFTVLLGSFLEQITEGEAAPSRPMPRSKRPRANLPRGEPSSAQRNKTARHSKLDQDAPSCSRRQTRGMSTEGHAPDFQSLPDESEEDLLSDNDQDEEDEEHEFDDEDSDPENESWFHDDGNDGNGDHDGNEDDDGNANLPPILEEEEPGIGNEGADVEGAEVEDSLDRVPQNVCLEALNKDKNDNFRSNAIEPQPLDVIPPEAYNKTKSDAQRRKEKLRLPRQDSLDFTPPEIDIMKFIEEGPSNVANSTPMENVEVDPPSTNDGSSFSEFSDGDFAKLDNDVVMYLEKKKAAETVVCEVAAPSTSNNAASGTVIELEKETVTAPNDVIEIGKEIVTPAVVVEVAAPSTSKNAASGTVIELEKETVTPPNDVIEIGKEIVTPAVVVEDAPHASASREPATANSSVTPAFVPHPRRIQKSSAALQSPYIDLSKKKTFRCSKEVCDVYATVCAYGNTRSTRSTQDEDVCIISFPSFYVTRGQLALSIKPGGKLINTVAEIGIYAIDHRGRKAVKRVLPLRVTTFIQQGNLTSNQVSNAFFKRTEHLDHRQMVMFPVLQMYGDPAAQVGHYFLLVLNLRNERFEVLDSMRSLQDESLAKCCNTLMAGIKELWVKHGYEEKKPICNFEVLDIGVPMQSNNHDCGFHMLLHAEHWDGSSLQYFKESDIPNARKVLLYKWLTHKENWVDWKEKI